METKKQLTMRDFGSAKPGDVLWDKGQRDSVRGLHLKIFAKKKAYYLYYVTKDGIQRRPKLGEHPSLHLNDARRVARSWHAKVALGGDPSRERRELRGEMTLDELFIKTCKGVWETTRYKNSGWGRDAKNFYKKNIKPTFGKHKISNITAASIRNWHQGFEAKPYAGNRSLAVLSRMFTYAEEQEWRPQNSNPCKLVKNFEEEKRSRFATKEELALIGEILKREFNNHPKEAAFLYLLLFCGIRPKALETAKKEQLRRIEFEGQTFGVLTFDRKTVRGKTGQETVYLPPQALSILDSLPSSENERLLGIKMPRKLWSAIRAEANCPDLWARDSRRTFSTIGMSGGLDMSLISELLNHKTTQTTKVYAKLTNDARLDAVSQIAHQVENLLGG